MAYLLDRLDCSIPISCFYGSELLASHSEGAMGSSKSFQGFKLFIPANCNASA